MNITVIKIGGSVLTDKGSDSLSVKTPVLSRIIDELISTDTNLVVVHGGGSFGHTPARKYLVHMGNRSSTPKAASIVMNRMLQLNQIVMEVMVEKGLAPINIPPHAMLGILTSFSSEQIELIRLALSKGFTPILFGDVMLDVEMGFKIVSGDYVAAELAILLHAGNLIFGTNVDGVFRNPRDPSSLLDKIDRNTSFESETSDVTGGIRYKVEQGLRAAKAGIRTLIINAEKPGNIKKAIGGESVVGTEIVWD